MSTVQATPSTLARKKGFLAAITAQPRPEEPTGLGAVVRVGNGDLFIRTKLTSRHRHWSNAYGMNGKARYRWGDLPLPITVLSPGVEVTL